MRLSMKLTAVAFLNMAVLIALFGWLETDHELRLYDQDLHRDASLLARALAGPVSTVWEARGDGRAMDLVESVNHSEHQVAVRWVWLDGDGDEPTRPALRDERLAGLEPDQILIVEETEGEAKTLFTYVRLPISTPRPAGLELSESLAPRRAFARRLATRTWLLALSIAVSGGLLSWFTGVRLVGTPVSRLIEKTGQIAEGELDNPLILQGSDEFGDLAEALNVMATRLREAHDATEREQDAKHVALDQARHQDRLRTVGSLASGIAHELGTPLNVVTGRATLIGSGDLPDEEIAASARIIREQGDRMSRIIRHLLDIARRPTPSRRPLDLRRVIGDTVELLEAQARKAGVDLDADLPAGPTQVVADRGQIDQVLTNLAMNAVHASRGGGRVTIATCIEDARPPGEPGSRPRSCAVLAVSDDGEGIAEEDQPHVFDPFFTRKEVGLGTGLGLSIAHEIVVEHGGWITVQSELGVGSTFRVYLPEEAP